MSDKDVEEFINKQYTKPDSLRPQQPEATKPIIDNYAVWDDLILPKSTYLVTGDVGTGKSGLCHWLIERYSAKYDLQPCVVGFPVNKLSLIPSHFKIIADVDDVVNQENSIVFVDEAGIQLPLDDIKVRDKVSNFLAQHRQRRQILILGYHFPRLVLARYLAFFNGFLFKRPPYLIEFASKSKNDTLVKLMYKAEERFAEMIPPNWKPSKDETQPLQVKQHTYAVGTRIRWQGMLENPLPSYWTQDLSEVWAGTKVDGEETGAPPRNRVNFRLSSMVNS